MTLVHRGHYAGCPRTLEGCRCKTRRYLHVFWIAAIFFAIEVTVGLLSRSGALVADAVHMLTDNVAIIIALVVANLERNVRLAETARSLGRTLIIVLLIAFAAYAICDSGRRILFEPELAVGWAVILVGAIGAGANLLQHRILESAPSEHKDAIHHGNVVHVLGDLFISIGVVTGGVITHYTEIHWVDPAISAGIALWIFYMAIKMIRAGSTLEPGHHHGHDHHGHKH